MILKYLSSGKKLSTIGLIKEFNQSKKIIQTDFKKYLIPLFCDDTIYYCSKCQKYTSSNNFLSKTLYSAEELALISILKAKSNDKNIIGLYDKTHALFHKFEDLLTNVFYQKLSIEKIDDFKKEIIKIKNAIELKSIINCFYKRKYRRVYPLKILNLEGFWYLIIYEIKDNKVKTFHLNTIKEIEILNKTYTYDTSKIKSFDNAITAYHKLNVKPLIVQLFCESSIAIYFLRKPLSPKQRLIKEYENGDIEIELIISDFMEIIPTIQRYIPYVKVIEPKDLRTMINKNLEKYIKENE
jgi:predicted DNA-binding transcriptional regulator YafY